MSDQENCCFKYHSESLQVYVPVEPLRALHCEGMYSLCCSAWTSGFSTTPLVIPMTGVGESDK